jgi:hypothetical protein
VSRRRAAGFVLALAEDGEREGEQKNQNRDQDHECQTLAQRLISSLKPRGGAILYQPPRHRPRFKITLAH